MFIDLNDIYEPSAILQLPDGRFLVAEDEKDYPFSLLAIRADGTTMTEPLDSTPAQEIMGKLDDLEGLATDNAGFVYAITSHSRNGKGEEKKSRNKLLRFRIENNCWVSPVLVSGLRAALTAAHPVLASAAAVPDVKSDEGLNVEALEMTPDGQRLLIGFRSPLLNARAMLASIENTSAVFEAGAVPVISPQLITLNLDGHGLRALSWIPALNGYLLVSGPVAKEQVQFRLWFWTGRPDENPRPVTVPGLLGFEHAEGITPAIIAGQQKIVIVSDDGNREEARPARFLILDPRQLVIAP